MANIFIDGDEIAKLKDILETIINPSIQSFQPNADLNNLKSGFYRDANLSLKNKPDGIDTFALYVALDFKGWGILQFAFPATKNTVYYRSIALSPTVWNELGGVKAHYRLYYATLKEVA